MKRLSNLLAALVFASLVIFMSCGGGGDDPGTTDLEIDVQNLTVSGGWTASSVQNNNEAPDGNWDGFELTFQGNVDGGTYTTNVNTLNPDNDFTAVWPASGSWTISDDGNTITRSDGVAISVDNITETGLSLSFTVAGGARVSGIPGNWTFVFGN